MYSYKSTPLSACTVLLYLYILQCLYSTAIPQHTSEVYSADLLLLPLLPVKYSYKTTPLSTCRVQL